MVLPPGHDIYIGEKAEHRKSSILIGSSRPGLVKSLKESYKVFAYCCKAALAWKSFYPQGFLSYSGL